MTIQLVKGSDKYAGSYCHAVDIVAKERKFLASTTGFPLESTMEYVRHIEHNNYAQFFALDSGSVVGWCDILPKQFEGLQHVGVLGMGVIATHRRQGIGRQLLRLALDHAKRVNKIEKVELEVFKSNTAAIKLYAREGFGVEGEKIDSRKLDGAYDNIVLMGKKL
jgi:ribosomal protein S18 acetylase RimI-like enzyme